MNRPRPSGQPRTHARDSRARHKGEPIHRAYVKLPSVGQVERAAPHNVREVVAAPRDNSPTVRTDIAPWPPQPAPGAWF